MYAFIGWTKRVALAALLLALFYVVADHTANKDRIAFGGISNAWTFGAEPSNGAGAEVCTYFSPAPSAFTSQQLGQVRCDANQMMMVDVSAGSVQLATGSNTIGAVTPLLPFNSTTDAQANAANSNVGLVSSNTGSLGGATTNDRVRGYEGTVAQSWANNRTILPTSTTTGTCQSISASKGYLAQVINSGSMTETATISLYDDSGTTCASATKIYTVMLSSSAAPILMIPVANGIAFKIDQSMNDNITVTYFKK